MKDKKAIGTVKIKGTKAIWQLNTKCDPGLDPGNGKKKLLKGYYWTIRVV